MLIKRGVFVEIKTYIDRAIVAAYQELSFTYQRQIYSELESQAALLAHRSPEEINKYLSTRAYHLRQSSGKVRAINPEELYVIMHSKEDEDSFECAYLHGFTYYEPPLLHLTTSQMKEMWEYLFTLPGNKQWMPFQDFFEKKIIEALSALHRYENMLEEEIVPLEYALMSSQGVSIHNTLYALAKETLAGLRGQVRLFKRGRVPVFIQHELARKLKIAKQTLYMLEHSKPRNV